MVYRSSIKALLEKKSALGWVGLEPTTNALKGRWQLNHKWLV